MQEASLDLRWSAAILSRSSGEAEVIRIGKGHTEGLEPRVTEALIELLHFVGENEK